MAKVKAKQQPVLVSCDPEVFIGTKGTKGTNRKKIVPVCGLVGGTKKDPIAIPGLTKGFMMQEDGVALEFNIPPAADYLHFNAFLDQALNQLGVILGDKNLTIIPKVCSHKFPLKDIEKYPQALIVGCSPDTDAYMRQAREGMNTDLFNDWRFCAGHFHISFPNPHNIPNYIFARFLDAYLTLATIPVDKQGERRKFYGLAGLYRDTKYPDGSTGLEYRTLSNFWVFEPAFRQQLSRSILNIISLVNSDVDGAAAMFDAIPWNDVKKAIDTENEEMAKKVYDFINLRGREVFSQQIVTWGISQDSPFRYKPLRRN